MVWPEGSSAVQSQAASPWGCELRRDPEFTCRETAGLHVAGLPMLRANGAGGTGIAFIHSGAFAMLATMARPSGHSGVPDKKKKEVQQADAILSACGYGGAMYVELRSAWPAWSYGGHSR